MNEEKKPAKKVARVTIRPQTENMLRNWRAQVEDLHPNFSPSDRQLVEWVIERLPILSKKEIQEMKGRYFDEVKELESLLNQLREAKADSNQRSMSELLATVSFKRKAAHPALPPSSSDSDE